MGKRNDLPTKEKMERIGFQDGFSLIKSREDEYLKEYTNRRINSNEIKIRILSYLLGYKRGSYVARNGVSNIKTIKGEIAANGKVLSLSNEQINIIDEKINNSFKTNKSKSRKKRR